MNFWVASGWHCWQVPRMLAWDSVESGLLTGRMLCEPWQSMQVATDSRPKRLALP